MRRLLAPKRIKFGFGGARHRRKLIGSLSSISIHGHTAWTVSDEGNTIERFCRRNDRFEFQFEDSLEFSSELLEHEMDLESIDVQDSRIWICGSHSRVRPSGKNGPPGATIEDRPERNVLGSLGLKCEEPAMLTRSGPGSLRSALSQDPHLAPFMQLAAKENGFDIEGMLVRPDRVLLGLRGPVIGGHAMVVSLRRSDRQVHLDNFVVTFVDLNGLGIRDLCGDGDQTFILAGPATPTDGPFRLYCWTQTNLIKLHDWSLTNEHPEGVCAYQHGGKRGLVVVYDKSDKDRRGKDYVMADWFEMA